MRDNPRGDGSDRSLLDPCLPTSGGARLQVDPRQSSTDQERSWTQKRCAGLPVDPAVAYLRVAGRVLPTRRSLLCPSFLCQVSRRVDWNAQHPDSAYAKGAAANERAVEPGPERRD